MLKLLMLVESLMLVRTVLFGTFSNCERARKVIIAVQGAINLTAAGGTTLLAVGGTNL